MLPKHTMFLIPCILLSSVGLGVGDDLDLGPVKSLEIKRVKPFGEHTSILLGDTYQCDRSEGEACTAANMCEGRGFIDFGPEKVSFTPYRAGIFECRIFKTTKKFVVYEKIVARRGEIKVKAIGNLKLTAPDGGLRANVLSENFGAEARDGRLSVYHLPFYDDGSRSFRISVVMENSSVYEVPLTVMDGDERCEDSESMTQVTVTRDLGRNGINSFENQMAALKCIGEKFSDDGQLLDGACLPEKDDKRPSFPMLFKSPKLPRGSAECFGYSLTNPEDNIVNVPTPSEPQPTPTSTEGYVPVPTTEPTVSSPSDGSDPDGKSEDPTFWSSVFQNLTRKSLFFIFLGAILICYIVVEAVSGLKRLKKRLNEIRHPDAATDEEIRKFDKGSLSHV